MAIHLRRRPRRPGTDLVRSTWAGGIEVETGERGGGSPVPLPVDLLEMQRC